MAVSCSYRGATAQFDEHIEVDVSRCRGTRLISIAGGGLCGEHHSMLRAQTSDARVVSDRRQIRRIRRAASTTSRRSCPAVRLEVL